MDFLVMGFTSFAFDQKFASNSGISDVSMASSGMFCNSLSRFGEILIVGFYFLSSGFSGRDDADNSISFSMRYCDDNDTLYCADTDFSDFSVVETLINGGKYDSVKDLLSFFKTNAMFPQILGVFVFIPFK